MSSFPGCLPAARTWWRCRTFFVPVAWQKAERTDVLEVAAPTKTAAACIPGRADRWPGRRGDCGRPEVSHPGSHCARWGRLLFQGDFLVHSPRAGCGLVSQAAAHLADSETAGLTGHKPRIEAGIHVSPFRVASSGSCGTKHSVVCQPTVPQKLQLSLNDDVGICQHLGQHARVNCAESSRVAVVAQLPCCQVRDSLPALLGLRGMAAAFILV